MRWLIDSDILRRHAVGGKRQAPCDVRRAFCETSLSL
jgi:hypothetical protein